MTSEISPRGKHAPIRPLAMVASRSFSGLFCRVCCCPRRCWRCWRQTHERTSARHFQVLIVLEVIALSSGSVIVADMRDLQARPDCDGRSGCKLTNELHHGFEKCLMSLVMSLPSDRVIVTEKEELQHGFEKPLMFMAIALHSDRASFVEKRDWQAF
mmetsp:Transcript_84595/g.220179  ORF Transcript_84595/g.220179 Transcript_84595/m.220179 type:complete len:157 (-) Transcript_84595:11-481(-)